MSIGLCAALVSIPVPTLAADDQVAPPPTLAEAKGPWTLTSGGRAICVLDLGEEKIGVASFALTVPLACGDALPTSALAWAPAADGVRLVGYDDRLVMRFSRLRDGLLVDHSSSGDLLLRRGTEAQALSTISEPTR